MKTEIKCFAAAVALALATPAVAQNTTAGMTADPMATTTTQERDDDFPWGLLGLLGLAGLLGLKKRDRDDNRGTTSGTGRM